MKIRSLFKLAEIYKSKMNPQLEPAPVQPPARGILERLKQQDTVEGIVAVCSEFDTYKQASAKTVRRFSRILRGLSKSREGLRDALLLGPGMEGARDE